MPLIVTDMLDTEEFDITLSDVKNVDGQPVLNPVIAYTRDNAKVVLNVSPDTLTCEVESITGQKGLVNVVAASGSFSQQYQITVKASAVATATSTLSPKRPRS